MRSDHELRKKRTGKPTGTAHAYRVNKPSKRTHQTSNGEYRRKWMGYLNEWVQEDGSSKFYITDETWEDWYPWYPGTGSTMMGMNELLSVQEFATLRAAQAAWDGVAEPIVQGVATEEMQKPLERVVPCRWCKGNPMRLLMLEGYVPCTECGPKVVTTVHDEVRIDAPTPDVSIREKMLKLFQRDVQAQNQVQEGLVLKEPMVFKSNYASALHHKMQVGDRIERPGTDYKKALKFLGEKGKMYRITVMSDAHYGVPADVKKIAAQVKAGTNPILNWLLNGDSQIGKERTSRSSTKSEEYVMSPELRRLYAKLGVTEESDEEG